MPEYRNHDPQVKAITGSAAYTTVTNVMTDAFAAIKTVLFGTKHFHFTGATNTVNVQILGSYDGGTTWVTSVSSFGVASGATVTQTVTTPYTHMKVQMDPAVDNVHGTVTTRWFIGDPY